MIAVPHLLHRLRAVAQRFQRRFLRHRRRAHDRILVNLHHRVDDLPRPAGVTHRLRKTVQENRPLPHSRQRRDRNMFAFIQQFGVDFVGQYDQVVFNRNLGDLFQIFAGHHRAGRIAREIQQQRPAFRRDLTKQNLRIECKTVLRISFDHHGHAVRHADFSRIRHKTRLSVNHFIARIHQCAHRDIQRLADADGDDALVFRIVFDVVILLHIAADFPAQRRSAEVGGIAGMPFFQRKNSGFPDGPRRGEIGFPDAETDHVVHRIDQIEKAADAALGQSLDMVGNQRPTDTL